LTTFSDIAERYIKNLGFQPYHCSSEQEARDLAKELIKSKFWPCYFFKSDTSGEKDFEEFYTDEELLDMDSFKNLGIIKNESKFDDKILDNFIIAIEEIRRKKTWNKSSIVKIFNEMIPNFDHRETGKYLDDKM
jgi:hypothetical protein